MLGAMELVRWRQWHYSKIRNVRAASAQLFRVSHPSYIHTACVCSRLGSLQWQCKSGGKGFVIIARSSFHLKTQLISDTILEGGLAQALIIP